MFKDVYRGALGKKADQYQTIGFLVSSACAEVIADVLLCPWEAVSTHSFGVFRMPNLILILIGCCSFFIIA